MIVQYLQAALVSENKMLAQPASIDSIPTSAGQEDHVSMAMHAAVKGLALVRNVRRVVAAELLCAAQGIEFLRPLSSSALLEALHAGCAGSCRRWTETGGRTRIWRRSTRGSRRAAPPTRRGRAVRMTTRRSR